MIIIHNEFNTRNYCLCLIGLGARISIEDYFFSGKRVMWITGITSPVFLFFSLPQCLPRKDCLLQQSWSTFLFSGCALHHRSPFILPFISLFICGNFHMWIFQAFCRTSSLLSGFHAMAFRPLSLRNTSQAHSLSAAHTVALSYAG